MASWVVVAEEADLPPGTMIAATVGRLALLVANVGGGYYATQAACTHVGGPLPEGSLSRQVVMCPWHGSRFDVTNGAVLAGPAARPLRTFPARLLGGKIQVEVP